MTHTRSLMGLKKRSLSQSSAASQVSFATKDRSLELAAKSAKKERPRLFRARHGAGERVASNLKLAKPRTEESTRSALSQNLKRRQSLAFQHFKKRTAAGGNVAHVFFDTVLGNGG
jgi:hypothetical protein